MHMHYSAKAVTQNLIDADCDEAIINAFMSDLQSGKGAKAMALLQKHRRQLLGDLHTAQKKIDCLDYFLFMLQKSKLQENENDE